MNYNANDWGILHANTNVRIKKQLKSDTDTCKETLPYDNITVSKSIFGLFSLLINKFERTKSYQTNVPSYMYEFDIKTSVIDFALVVFCQKYLTFNKIRKGVSR